MQTIEVQRGVYIHATDDPRRCVERAQEGEVGQFIFWPDDPESYGNSGYVYLGTVTMELKLNVKDACVEAAKQLEKALEEKQKKHREEVANMRARIDSLLALEYTPAAAEPQRADDPDFPF